MMNVRVGDCVESEQFSIDNIMDWKLKLYPKGESTKNANCFIVLLQPLSIPSLWDTVRYCRTIKCAESGCSDTGISTTKNAKVPRATGWADPTMNFEDFQGIVTRHGKISFVVTINVLEVALRCSGRVIHPFQPPLTGHRHRFQWQINHDLIEKFKASHFGQDFESELFEEMFCLRMYSHWPSEGDLALSLRLCCLPPNARRVDLRYSTHCGDFKAERRVSMDYEHQSSPPIKMTNVSRLGSVSLMTVVLEIEIVHIESAKSSLVTSHQSMDIDSELFEDSDSEDGLISFDRPRDGNMGEVQRYKEALDQLVRFATTSTTKPFRETSKIHELRKLARKQYPSTRNRTVIESDEKGDEIHFDAIIEYIKSNSTRRRGDVVIRCHGAPRDDWLEQKKALEVFTVTFNERSPALVGQRGLRALVRIPRGTVIGEYFGREWMENEFDDIYSGTKDWVDINEYALCPSVEVKIPYSKLKYFANVGGVEKVRGSRDKWMVEEYHIVVDGLNKKSRTKAMMIFMNDCRRDIFMTNMTDDDERVMNAKLMTVYHNGWPRIFVVATKDVEQNEEVFTFYGKQHVRWEQDKRRYAANEKLHRQNIQRLLDHYDVKGMAVND